MSRNPRLRLWLLAASVTACDGVIAPAAPAPDAPLPPSPADAPARTGVFPDIAALARQVSPVLAPPGASRRSGYSPAPEWADAERMLYDVLGDASDLRTAPITRVHALVGHAQWLIDEINGCHFDRAGEPTACTPVPAGAAVEMPWMHAQGEQPFFAFDDTGVYRCSFRSRTGGRVFFGRAPIADAPASCADPFEYHFLDGEDYAEPNPDMPEVRGETRTISQGFRVRYDGCSSDLRLVYAHASGYARAGVPTLAFSSRSELIGNARTHEFRLRIAKRDGALGGAALMTTEAAGRSRADTPGELQHLVISLRRFLPDTSTAPAIDQRFCLEVRGATFTPAASGCEAYDATFATIPPLSGARVPAQRFSADFGSIPPPSGASMCGGPGRADGGAGSADARSPDGGRLPLQGHSIVAPPAEGPDRASGDRDEAAHDGRPEPAALRPGQHRGRLVRRRGPEQRDQRAPLVAERDGHVVVRVEPLDEVLGARRVAEHDRRPRGAADLAPGTAGAPAARADGRHEPERIADHPDAQHQRATGAGERQGAQPQPDAAVEPARGDERLEHLGRRVRREVHRGIEGHREAERVQRGLALARGDVRPAEHTLPRRERLAREPARADLAVRGHDRVLVARLGEQRLRGGRPEEREDDERAHRPILPDRRPP